MLQRRNMKGKMKNPSGWNNGNIDFKFVDTVDRRYRKINFEIKSMFSKKYTSQNLFKRLIIKNKNPYSLKSE